MKICMKLAATFAFGLLMLGSVGWAEDAHHPATPEAGAAGTEILLPATDDAPPAAGMMAAMWPGMKMGGMQTDGMAQRP